jgi:phenylacetate-CoA ligase
MSQKPNLNAPGLWTESAGRHFLTRPEIQKMQLAKTRRLLKEILPANPFYARKLASIRAGYSPKSMAEFARQLPFTTRHELVRDRLASPPYGTDLTYPVEHYVRCHQTSGTTTVPMRWLDTRESWDHIVTNWVRILEAANVERRDRFFFAFSFGPFLGFWSALEAVQRVGCFLLAGGSMSSLARLQAILDNGITALCCTPTYAMHLGEVARERKADMARCRLRLIVVAGESGGSIPATRARLESLWPGARVFDHHGMTEVGPVTYQCPEKPGRLHVIESAYFPEVIESATGQPADPGSTGELVLTTLDRLGSPLLRYRTGDLVRARPSAICECGRQELALEGGILGRSDDMIVVRGVNVYPSLIEDIVRGHGEILEYRVKCYSQNSLMELELEIEAATGCDDPGAAAADLQESIQSVLNLRVPVRALPTGSLPRFEMKAARWVKISE